VAAELGDAVELVLDGGPCQAGIESTIVAVLPDHPPVLLRSGAIARERIEALVGALAAPGESVMAPGQLRSHYAPRARLRLNADRAEAGEVLLGFGPSAPADGPNLSPVGDLAEAAANLYRMLRVLDASGVQRIAVMRIPSTGLGEALNDRLRRAAAPRDVEPQSIAGADAS
jgi:L-threonylcarbamoyladenylate synthase